MPTAFPQVCRSLRRGTSDLRVGLLSPAHDASYCAFSSVAFSVTSLPALSAMVRCQLLKPDDPTEIMWSPGDSFSVEGVLPTNLPSTLMSAPSGMDLTTTLANPAGGADEAAAGAGLAVTVVDAGDGIG